MLTTIAPQSDPPTGMHMLSGICFFSCYFSSMINSPSVKIFSPRGDFSWGYVTCVMNSTALSAQPYLFAWTSLLPGSGCCDCSDHPTVCVTRYTYRDRETIAHIKKRNTDWALHTRVGHHWIKVTKVLQ